MRGAVWGGSYRVGDGSYRVGDGPSNRGETPSTGPHGEAGTTPREGDEMDGCTFVASSLIAAWLTLCVMRAVFIPTVDAKMTLFPSSGKIGKKVHPGPDVQFPMAPTPAPDDGGLVG